MARAALLAGFIAGSVWMAITVLVGGFSDGAIVGGGFGFIGRRRPDYWNNLQGG